MKTSTRGAGRPTKKERVTLAKRDKELMNMRKIGYPVSYLADYFGLSTTRVSLICKRYYKQQKGQKH